MNSLQLSPALAAHQKNQLFHHLYQVLQFLMDLRILISTLTPTHTPESGKFPHTDEEEWFQILLPLSELLIRIQPDCILKSVIQFLQLIPEGG